MTALSLELKIPPVVVALVFFLLIWLIDIVLPGTVMAGSVRWVVIVLLVLAGAFFPLAAVVSFKNARTTVNPLKPDESSKLVTSGVFQYSRNPMYLGLLLSLLAWSLYLSNLYAMAFCGLFLLYMNRFQIKAEERALVCQFGTAYISYQARVRRWL